MLHTNEFTITSPAKFLNKRRAGQSDLSPRRTALLKTKGQYGKTPASLSDMGKILFGYEGFSMPVLFTEKRRDILAKKEEKSSGASEREKKREKQEKIMKLKWRGK